MAGANRSLAELVTHLPEWVEPFVVVADDGPVAAFYRDAGVEYVVLPPGGVWGRYGLRNSRRLSPRLLRGAAAPLFSYWRRIHRIVRERSIDLVHANDFRGALLTAPAARAARRPVVSHLRGEFPFGRAASAAFAILSDRILAVSEGARSTLAWGRGRTDVVYNGIRPIAAPAQRIAWLERLRQEGVVVVTCFASVVPFKGHHHLARAVAELNRRGSGERAVFVCVGDFVDRYEDYQQWLQGLVRDLDVRNLTFTGWQPDPFPFYGCSDAAVLASVTSETLRMGGRAVEVRGSEGFPRSHLEAMQFGLPIVGTRIAGVPEQIDHGTTGLLVEPGDARGLADALERLIGDADLRRRMGAAGRERVNRLFSTHTYVEQVVEAYHAVLRR